MIKLEVYIFRERSETRSCMRVYIYIYMYIGGAESEIVWGFVCFLNCGLCGPVCNWRDLHEICVHYGVVGIILRCSMRLTVMPAGDLNMFKVNDFRVRTFREIYTHQLRLSHTLFSMKRMNFIFCTTIISIYFRTTKPIDIFLNEFESFFKPTI